MPSFLPASVRPAHEGHSPRRIAASVCGMRLSTAIIRPKPSSIVERAIAPIACTSDDAMPTSTPARVAAAMSMWYAWLPVCEISSRPGMAAKKAASKLVRSRIAIRIGYARMRSSGSGSVYTSTRARRRRRSIAGSASNMRW
jgi:hypothetical protein